MARPNRNVIDSGTITIRVPIAVRKRGGRKTVTTPDGLSALAPARAHVDRAVVNALARAFRWRMLIETGMHRTIQEIADVEKLNASYVGRVLRLALLAPDLIQAILDDHHRPKVTLDALMRPFPVRWADQPRFLKID
jgi:hypothetical protein